MIELYAKKTSKIKYNITYSICDEYKLKAVLMGRVQGRITWGGQHEIVSKI